MFNSDTNTMTRDETMTRERSAPRDQERLGRDETTNLISSEKVDGTVVYNREGERLGSIHHFMVGKRNGRVEYAVLSFGGLFGMGERYHPLPWKALDYDTGKGGFVVDIDKEQLKSGPSFERGQEPRFDRDYGEKVYGHYGRSY